MDKFGKTISLFLIDGDPNRRWMCEVSNWNGKAYKIPRIDLKRCGDRADLSACGVYFLFGKHDLDNKEIVYIGEAENVYERLKQHDAPNGKDFWNECIVFIRTDNSLNKAHIKYLEHRCYVLAKEADRYEIDNSTVPADASLTEAEQAEMDEFFFYIRMITNVLGHKVLEELIPEEPDANDRLCINDPNRGTDAKGMATNGGFVVLKGSKAAETETKGCPKLYIAIREELKRSGVIETENWTFTEDKEFSSPSAAAAVVLGRSANGRIEWRVLPRE